MDVADLAPAVAVLIVGPAILATVFVEHCWKTVADLAPDEIHSASD